MFRKEVKNQVEPSEKDFSDDYEVPDVNKVGFTVVTSDQSENFMN